MNFAHTVKKCSLAEKIFSSAFLKIAYCDSKERSVLTQVSAPFIFIHRFLLKTRQLRTISLQGFDGPVLYYFMESRMVPEAKSCLSVCSGRAVSTSKPRPDLVVRF